MSLFARVLFDTGSEVNLISNRTVLLANLPKKKFSIQIEGVTGVEVADYIAFIKISPWYDECGENVLFKPCVVLKKLPPAQRIECSKDIPEFQNIVKADPNFHKAGIADILLGIDTWAEIIMERVLRSSTGLCAQMTTFGYAIFGAVKSTPKLTASISCIGQAIMSAEESHRLDELIQRFWENEEISEVERILSKDEQRAIDYYKKTTTRAANGQFIVRLPFIEDKPDLGESRGIVLQRFYQLERRLERDHALREKYNTSMREAIESGHMRLATAEERQAKGYYIPHHPITTRFRIVKDGSCATTNGKSINDIQLAGPNLQDKLEHVIMRFRFHQFVISADIKQMFLQIQMNDEDLKYQKIFWRFNKNDPLQEYVWKTVLFGMKSSPFIAIYTVLELAKIYEQKFPSASRAAKSERYVDDFMSGGDSIQQVLKLYEELKQLMAMGNFTLGKWKTNCPQLLEHINKDYHSDDQPLELNDNPTSILGLKWQPNSDCFIFTVNERWESGKQTTKRAVASAIARIYDPIGYLAPIMIKAKSFLQELWKIKLKWEELLPEGLCQEWHEFYNTLTSINDIRIPRWIQTTKGREIELIGFCDASDLGYGAQIYVRCASGSTVWCNLLTAKTKIAPVKPVTTPRLELCAAELLSKMMNVVRKKCDLEYAPYECYSDSTIALSWLRKCPSKLKIYVATRVQTIQTHTSEKHWFYVPTDLNPADIASRGMLASDLVTCGLWWNGPQFILQDRAYRQRFQLCVTSEDEEIIRSEYRPPTSARVTVKEPQPLSLCGTPIIERFSNLSRILLITAFVRKFIVNLKARLKTKSNNPSNKRRITTLITQNQPVTIGSVSNQELNSALNYWIKYTQSKFYANEINQIKQDDEIDKKSSLVQLCPFLDSSSLLRVQGRLENANITYDEKHPIILPYQSRLATLLFEEAHRETMHGGIQLMLHYVRAKYWIVGARKAAALIVKKCLACVRFAHHDKNQIMGALPKERLSNTRPFAYCGVDYFGPIRIKRYEGRCNSIDTGYAAVFICMTTRMVHIECVSDLTTERFLWSFARLTSIYHMPSGMFSDNAKTFIGAKNELCDVIKTWKSKEMENFLNMKGLRWKFITPRAPNQGGIWEAAVKSAKHHLKRMILDKSLTFERYQTLFAKISAVLNSRPLVPLSDNPQDLNYLTPSHAMIGERVVQPLCGNLSDIPMNRIKQQKILDKIQQDFWNVWRKEYLGTLQNRYKWNRNERNMSVGDFVLLKEDNVPPATWPVARVIETFPGADNKVRSVKIRTPRAEYVRPISKLVLLPLEGANEEPAVDSIWTEHPVSAQLN